MKSGTCRGFVRLVCPVWPLHHLLCLVVIVTTTIPILVASLSPFYSVTRDGHELVSWLLSLHLMIFFVIFENIMAVNIHFQQPFTWNKLCLKYQLVDKRIKHWTVPGKVLVKSGYEYIGGRLWWIRWGAGILCVNYHSTKHCYYGIHLILSGMDIWVRQLLTYFRV